MNISIVIDSLKEDLSDVAELGDERAAGVARRLTDMLGSALRLRLLEVLSQAALELSGKLPSGHVEVRLAGQDPEFVYVEDEGSDGGGGVSEELSARITLRIPEGLKGAVEQAATREGVSVNTWLVRAIARSIERGAVGQVHRGGRRMTGYGQS
jgi:hypothetical protein